MGIPLAMVPHYFNDPTGKPADILQAKITEYALYMLAMAVEFGFFKYCASLSFGTLGTNVTQSVRELLYSKILDKNLGWFDF